MKNEAATLIEIFQGAIADFTHHVEARSGLSADEIEKANYIVGTAKMNVHLLEHIEAHSRAKADRFLREASKFAASLQAEGCGIPARLAIQHIDIR